MADICGDGRFEVIERAKKALLDSTNISESPDEVKVLDNFLFRCWQMGWLDKYERNGDCETCNHYNTEVCGECFKSMGDSKYEPYIPR